MRRKDIAAFFGILCYTLTVFAGLYVYYTKTTMLYGTICETESKGYRKEAERKKHTLELRMPSDKSVYKEQASASADIKTDRNRIQVTTHKERHKAHAVE